MIPVTIEFMDYITYSGRWIPCLPSKGDCIWLEDEDITHDDLGRRAEYGEYDDASFSPQEDGSYKVTLFVSIVWIGTTVPKTRDVEQQEPTQ